MRNSCQSSELGWGHGVTYCWETGGKSSSWSGVARPLWDLDRWQTPQGAQDRWVGCQGRICRADATEKAGEGSLQAVLVGGDISIILRRTGG